MDRAQKPPHEHSSGCGAGRDPPLPPRTFSAFVAEFCRPSRLPHQLGAAKVSGAVTCVGLGEDPRPSRSLLYGMRHGTCARLHSRTYRKASCAQIGSRLTGPRKRSTDTKGGLSNVHQVRCTRMRAPIWSI